MNNREEIIKLIVKQAKSLLANHWLDIEEYRDGAAEIKVSFASKIDVSGPAPIVETSLSFSKRVKDSVTDSVETDQGNLSL